jgi:putative transposase
MDGKGSYNDNLFVERLWRTVKYEEVFLRAYQDAREARMSLGSHFCFYNTERPLQVLGYQTPAEVYKQATMEVTNANMVKSLLSQTPGIAGPALNIPCILSK